MLKANFRKSIGRGSKVFLWALLSFFIFWQLLSLFLVFTGGLPVARFFEGRLNVSLKEYDLRVEVGSAQLVSPNEIECSDIKVFFTDERLPFLLFEKGWCSLSKAWFFSKKPTGELLLSSFQFNVPPVISPTGEPLALIEDGSLECSLGKEGLNFFGELEDNLGLRAYLSLNLTWEQIKLLMGDSFSGLSIKSEVYKWLKAFLPKHDALNVFTKPILYFDVSSDSRGDPFWAVSLFSEKVTFGDWVLNNIWVSRIEGLEAKFPDWRLSCGQLNYLEGSSLSSVEGFWAGDLSYDKSWTISGSGDLFLGSIGVEGSDWGDGYLKAKATDNSHLELSAQILSDKKTASRIEGSLDLNNESGKLFLETNGSFGVSRFLSVEKPPFGIPKLPLSIALSDELLGRGSLELASSWKFKRFTYELFATDLTLGDAKIDWASLSGVITPEFLEINDASFGKGGAQVGLNYHQDFKSTNYRLLLTGGADPKIIKSWFGSWWSSLWDSFNFEQSVINADLDLQGRFSDPLLYSLFGQVQIKQFAYKGVSIDDCALNVFMEPELIKLYDMQVSRPEGQASGSIGWKYRYRYADPVYTALSFESTLSLKEIDPILPREVSETLSPFEFSMPPYVDVSAKSFNDPKLLGMEDTARVTLRTDSSVKYYNYPLENLDLSLDYAKNNANFSYVKFGFAGGEGLGWIVADTDTKWTTMGFSFKKIQNTEVVARSLGFVGAEEKINFSIGKLNLQVNAEGYYGSRETFSGRGQFEIKKGDLTRIRLLGVISQLTSHTFLSLGNVRLSDAESHFSILPEGELYFPDLRLTGPTARVEMNGTYSTLKDELNFKLKLYLMDEVRFPLLAPVAPVLRPFTNAFEATIKGSLADPKSRVKMSLFKKKKKKEKVKQPG